MKNKQLHKFKFKPGDLVAYNKTHTAPLESIFLILKACEGGANKGAYKYMYFGRPRNTYFTSIEFFERAYHVVSPLD